MQVVKDIVNFLSSPAIFFLLSIVAVVVIVRFKRLYTVRSGLVLLGAAVAFFLFSMTDENFYVIIAKPDNVPIVIMMATVGFFTWLGLRQAFENDRRMEVGQPPAEKAESVQKISVWPDLVYTEFICLIVLTVVLVLWSLLLKAPIEEPANPTQSPNPSKAPWYFLGLQEMLVYFDPWIAGVLLPSLIIVGLIALPYLDVNPKGNGYYTFKERSWEITLFLFGFIPLWVLLILLGTILRGPNWNFYGPYEFWDPNKVEPLVNVQLSELIWIKILGRGLPENMFLREMFGVILVVAYLAIPPLVLARTVLRRSYIKLGFLRYQFLISLILIMMALPIKMVLRWTLNLKYIVYFPEWFLNI
ncbi:MAG: hypothetical protein PVF68_10140 [Acidobacteriota bacterium]|jgi:hypothetical protein